MTRSIRTRIVCTLALVFLAVSATGSHAQTFTTLANFNSTDGSEPVASVIQGTDGNLYGTTVFGGTDGSGAVFKMTPAGSITTLHSFTGGNDGRYPYAALILGLDGNFYGTASQGGANPNHGVVFKITSTGTFTTLHSFDQTDGSSPVATLVQASNGTFYGTTQSGGANNEGTVFKMTAQGVLTTLHSFAGTDGSFPQAALIQATDGNLYGTTYQGGSNGIGTVFKITPAGVLTTLHSFTGFPSDGSEPYSPLIQAANGTFYGTTWEGGANDFGSIFTMNSAGTVALLHSFNGIDGGGVADPLIQATDGNFYGTTNSDGATSTGCTEGCGTVFQITSAGALTTLESFDKTDGSFPFAALFQATSGLIYGATQQGGTDGDGVVFSLSEGLARFAEILPTSGKVGSKVIILGSNLTGTTAVTFNGTAAAFAVVSNTEITATVPASATSGKVVVTTPHGNLKSNVTYRVTG